LKKLIFIVVALALMGSALALNQTLLNVINKTDYQVYIKGVSSEHPNNIWSQYMNPGDEVVLAIVTEPYWVQAQARECEIDFLTNRETCSDWELCYGFADQFYYDENRAARLMSFGKGMRKLPITKDSCQNISQPMRVTWENLPTKLYEYVKNVFKYQY